MVIENIYGTIMIKFNYPAGATPLDPDETEGLIPQHIHTQTELNQWEEVNILEAEAWINKHHFTTDDVLDIAFVKTLHKKMFDKTWKWAGKFRKTDKNIGVDWKGIPEKLKVLLDDVRYQLTAKTYSIDETAARFHHRLVAIHPFSNGNGRHARLATDLFLITEKHPRFSWGQNKHASKSTIRQAYIQALRAADKHHYEALFHFVRD